MGSAQLLHLVVGDLVQHERQVEGAGYTLVGDVVVGGADAAGGDDEVVVGGHAAGSFDDFALIVGNDFDALEVDAEGEAVLCEVGGVGVYRLEWKLVLLEIYSNIRRSFNIFTYLSTKHLISNNQARGSVDRPLATLLSHCY